MTDPSTRPPREIGIDVWRAVALTAGVVIANGTIGTRGFWSQDPKGDGNAHTSGAIFVFTNAAPTVTVGQSVRVQEQGVITEFTANIATNLSITVLISPVITKLTTSGHRAGDRDGHRPPASAHIDHRQ